MPARGSGHMHYAEATKSVAHGAPVIEDNIPGIAIKQVARAWSAGLTGQATIDVGESFGIEYTGVWYVPAVSGAAKGSLLYIDPTDNALSLSSGSDHVKFGKVKDLAGERGCPTGKQRVDLDMKSMEA